MKTWALGPQLATCTCYSSKHCTVTQLEQSKVLSFLPKVSISSKTLIHPYVRSAIDKLTDR